VVKPLEEVSNETRPPKQRQPSNDDGECRYPRTGVPPLAVPRLGSCSYL